jgi:hypothetical protein
MTRSFVRSRNANGLFEEPDAPYASSIRFSKTLVVSVAQPMKQIARQRVCGFDSVKRWSNALKPRAPFSVSLILAGKRVPSNDAAQRRHGRI